MSLRYCDRVWGCLLGGAGGGAPGRARVLSAAEEILVAIGADGVAGGWVAAACRVDAGGGKRAAAARELPLPEDRRVQLERFDDVAAIAELRDGTQAIVAIDVPLGLLEHGGA